MRTIGSCLTNLIDPRNITCLKMAPAQTFLVYTFFLVWCPDLVILQTDTTTTTKDITSHNNQDNNQEDHSLHHASQVSSLHHILQTLFTEPAPLMTSPVCIPCEAYMGLLLEAYTGTTMESTSGVTTLVSAMPGVLKFDDDLGNQMHYEIPKSVQAGHFNHVELAFIAPPAVSTPRRTTLGVSIILCLPSTRKMCSRKYVVGHRLEAWTVINLTDSFQTWLSNPENIFNLGNVTAQVTVTFPGLNVETSILVFRVLESRVHSYPFIGRVKRKTRSLYYNDDRQGDGNMNVNAQPINGVSQGHEVNEQPINSAAQIHNEIRRPHRVVGGCRLFPWSIKTRELQMDDFLVRPVEMTVNFCAGSCGASEKYVNRVSHGYLLSIYKARQHQTAPEDLQNPNCVPSKLAPMNVILKPKSGYEVITIPNVKAVQCACI